MSSWLSFAVPLSLEISLLLATMYCVYRAQKNRIYPAFWQFLIFWAASDGLMLVEGIVRRMHWVSGDQFYYAYRLTYWPCFAINAILMLRVLHEMFRHAVRSIPGVQKLGRPIFFWAIVVSVILAFAASLTPHAAGMTLLLACAQVLMRSQAVLALCMLTFLAFASRTLGVSYGSRIFGVIFGFGVMATATLVNSALLGHVSMTSVANLVLIYVNFVGIAVWAGYFLKPEPARRLVAMPVTSPLMRWNDIAQTLGNPAGQVAVAYPPSFMRDVQDLVNRVMGPAGWPTEATAASRPPGPIAS
jgi:hypothetical protein